MNDIDEQRPNPDELLASLIREEEKSKKGRLRIFLGMCAGVGKTYSMLQSALEEKSKGIDIIIGLVETHGRKETAHLMHGLEQTPRKVYEYKSAKIYEMDLDAILDRKPQVVLVDELAHTNTPGCRHTKRFHDVLELLENGISVYTTLNVQHLESRSETVAQITGITVRETVPDEIFENADEVELVDLTPDELLQRLSEGKVYTPERSREAVLNFFRKGNITALREMALRIVADRVDKQLHEYMQHKHIRGPWKSGLHLLVAIDYRSDSMHLLRWAKTLAYSMRAQIQAIYVETLHRLTQKEHEQLDKNIQLAKQLGIGLRITTNTDVVKAIVNHAEKENLTHIIIGKPRTQNLFAMYRLGNFLNRLIRYSGKIDVYILGTGRSTPRESHAPTLLPSFTSTVKEYVLTALFILITTTVCYLIREWAGYEVVSFILLILVSILAIFYGTGPILMAAILSAILWNFLFIPPQFTFHIEKPADIFMFAMFFIIALLNGVLSTRLRKQEKKIRIREERTNALYQLTRDLAASTGIDEVTGITVMYLHKYFSLEPELFLKNADGQLILQYTHERSIQLSDNDLSIADWVFRNSAKAGKYTETLPSSEYTFYPLQGISGNMGVIAVRHALIFTHGEEQFWEACVGQISGKYEREYLREVARQNFMVSESEKLYKNLFNSISHELKIPVSSIIGATDTLLSQDFPEDTRVKLYHEINKASIRLNRLIENLLNMSRLESGHIKPRLDWCDIHDLAGSVSESLKSELQSYQFTVTIPENSPLVFIDFGLIERAVYNLVLNAIQHSPVGTRIRLKMFVDEGNLFIQVMDRGRGFDKSEIPLLFNKFYRTKESKTGGTGLGLSIVKGFVESHKGSVVAENRRNGGALITVKIPVKIADIQSIKDENR